MAGPAECGSSRGPDVRYAGGKRATATCGNEQSCRHTSPQAAEAHCGKTGRKQALDRWPDNEVDRNAQEHCTPRQACQPTACSPSRLDPMNRIVIHEVFGIGSYLRQKGTVSHRSLRCDPYQDRTLRTPPRGLGAILERPLPGAAGQPSGTCRGASQTTPAAPDAPCY